MVARMVSRRIDKIVAKVEEQKKTSDAAMAKIADSRKRADHLRHAWLSVYPDAMTTKALEQTVCRLRDLVPLIEDRCWDFLISEMLEQDDLRPDAHVALLILGHACARDEDGLRHCLSQLERVPFAIPMKHGELLDVLEYRLSNANLTLPNTPPLSQEDLAKALGVTYDQVRWGVRMGKWLNPPEDRVKHKRPRRWQHKSDDVQRETLKKIRENCREVLWRTLNDEE
jgi:hypothetical protein